MRPHPKHHVTNEPTTPVEVLRKHFSKTRKEAEELVALGALYLDQERLTENLELPKGAHLRVYLDPKRYAIEGIKWRGTLIDETEDFLIVNKPFGIPIHATLDNARDNVLNQLRSLTGKPLFITHRIDIPVGGLACFAKTKEFQDRFNDWLRDRKVRKHYRAIVEKPVKTGLLRHFMRDDDHLPKKVKEKEFPESLLCELSILSCEEKRVGEKLGYQLEIDLHTGRTHQIRSQLSAVGSPIWGDKLYESKIPSPMNDPKRESIALFASSLQFANKSFTLQPPWA